MKALVHWRQAALMLLNLLDGLVVHVLVALLVVLMVLVVQLRQHVGSRGAARC